MRAFSRAWQMHCTMEFGFSGLEHEEFRDGLAAGPLVQLEKRRFIAGGLHDGQPVFGQLRSSRSRKSSSNCRFTSTMRAMFSARSM